MKPERFRKKPVVIRAIKLSWENWNDICDFMGVGLLEEGKPEGCYVDDDGHPTNHSNRLGISIPTLEGVMIGVEGDWIIEGVAGEFYPCRDQIFWATYERADA
jgi:hypothetical protein